MSAPHSRMELEVVVHPSSLQAPFHLLNHIKISIRGAALSRDRLLVLSQPISKDTSHNTEADPSVFSDENS